MPKQTVQIPPELNQRLAAAASRDNRSMQGQMLTYIQHGIERSELAAEMGALGAAVSAFETIQDPDARNREVMEALNSLPPGPRRRAIAYLIDRYGETGRRGTTEIAAR